MIFEEQVSRKPDHYPWAQEFIEAMHNGFWTDKEFSFSSDIQDFNVNLTEDETRYGMQYERLVTVLVNAVKELSTKVEELEDKLNKE